MISRTKMVICFVLPVYIIFYLSITNAVQSPALPPLENLDKSFKDIRVPQCEACRNLVTSFLQALEETSRSKYEGGDADWERQKLRTYENSELRLIEIQEILCHELGRGKDQCYNLAEVHEELLEEWFHKKRLENVDLLQFFCIDHLKICCPENTFGPNCVPCPGGVKTPCGGHGRCEKGGTREAPAKCECDSGYKGDLCDACETGYYKEMKPKLTCNFCDVSCKHHCRGPGPRHCEVCSAGYEFVQNEGCVKKDIEADDEEEEEDDDDDDESTNVSDKAERENDSKTATKEDKSDEATPHSEF